MSAHVQRNSPMCKHWFYRQTSCDLWWDEVNLTVWKLSICKRPPIFDMISLYIATKTLPEQKVTTYALLPPASAVEVIESEQSVYVCVGVCETYIVHHFMGTGLCCAPVTCIVHHQPALCTVVHKGYLYYTPWASINWSGLRTNTDLVLHKIIFHVHYRPPPKWCTVWYCLSGCQS